MTNWKKSNYSTVLEYGHWVDVGLRIKDMLTGEVRVFTEPLVLDVENSQLPSYYHWDEGNASCDCNRYLRFNSIQNCEVSFPCGETRYRVQLFNLDTQDVFYDEFDTGFDKEGYRINMEFAQAADSFKHAAETFREHVCNINIASKALVSALSILPHNFPEQK